MEKTEKKMINNHRGIGISWKLFAFLVVFVAFMMAVVWFFQVYMLENFYENAKKKELDNISLVIGGYVGTEELGEAVYSCAIDYSTCIRVFRVNDDLSIYEVASAEVSPECIIHNSKPGFVVNEKLNEYCRLAVDNGGVYTVTSEVKSKLGMFWSENVTADRPRVDRIDSNPSSVVMVYNRIVESGSGEKYMILLNSELTPVSATVSTLETQFYWIAGVMVVGALVLAFLISHNISTPIKKMNNSAKKLAQGRYDADFSVKGYKEIIELSKSLEDAADKLSTLDSLQRELIANVSHDLRTPLTLIKGYSEVMRDIPDENTPENLQTIIDETTHLNELVNDFLDLSKLRSGTRTPLFERFNLTETIRSVMTRYDKLVMVNGYKIVFEAQDEAWVFADKMMIVQVVYNLINNAVNYSGENKTVCVKQDIGADTVIVSIIDNGDGISPENLDSIWERYYKVDRVHKRARVGTGLGLSIVKGSLEAHRASYGVESAVGHGSRFWFSLSLCKAECKRESEN